MPSCDVNGIKIAYELEGPEDGIPVLFIMGLSLPLSGWPQAFKEAFTKAGYRLILIDNRDVGHSSQLDHLGTPNMLWQLIRKKIGLGYKAAYQLKDMMADVIALMDHLNIQRAHFVGVSMGGMITQLAAIHHPDRVITMTSIMSTTGNPRFAKVGFDVLKLMKDGLSAKTEEQIRFHRGRIWRAIGSPAYIENDQTALEARVSTYYDRGSPNNGTLRQLIAIWAAENRVPALEKINIPALVIHGEDDPLVPLGGGKDTANAIPGAKLVTYPGMGHDLPDALIPDITAHILEHLKR